MNLFTKFFLLLFLIAPTAHAQDPRLDLLREMMDAVCGEYQYSGGQQGVKISGDAEAKIGGIMNKLVDVGVSAAGEFNEKEYVGVLRAEAGAQLMDVRACRKKVFDDMKVMVVSTPVEKIEESETLPTKPHSALTPQPLLQPVTTQPVATAPVENTFAKETPNPSFDCNKAGTATEFTLCGDAYLASLDRRASALYFALRDRLGGQARKNLLASQREFLKVRNDCGASVPCLTAVQERRIVELDG
ncbi:hypothetical protein GCM10008927_15080 [Amylibacter ulvae]|uniref:Lysozyme inhibitor LprI N-terminal domain-containing protein n=2 Tax=Paramylibacter TaxID=3143987 RepID=A0A2G5K3Q4_9RHOB|nr:MULTISPECIES: lysozyme inhibitor LprI family protein [Amylibacter]PIB24045.1 hypothetical protein BFP76_02005 [Amylibacter kogurei]GHA50821.1 hypothetical protein GCM10008927_15080 [Amylibacter ulvae]